MNESNYQRSLAILKAQAEKIKASISAQDPFCQLLVKDLEYRYPSERDYRSSHHNTYMQHSSERATGHPLSATTDFTHLRPTTATTAIRSATATTPIRSATAAARLHSTTMAALLRSATATTSLHSAISTASIRSATTALYSSQSKFT
ncbi:unnamed protein product [Rotaria sp. Silwood2]|nr:unnamed protein product [Rotaria sp. Silwood2]